MWLVCNNYLLFWEMETWTVKRKNDTALESKFRCLDENYFCVIATKEGCSYLQSSSKITLCVFILVTTMQSVEDTYWMVSYLHTQAQHVSLYLFYYNPKLSCGNFNVGILQINVETCFISHT